MKRMYWRGRGGRGGTKMEKRRERDSAREEKKTKREH